MRLVIAGASPPYESGRTRCLCRLFRQGKLLQKIGTYILILLQIDLTSAGNHGVRRRLIGCR
jgi:hypothetical protein